MTTTDKILGIFLFFIALPFAIQADVHWLAVALLLVASAVFAGFVIQIKKARCGRCGHYYPLNAYEAYVVKSSSTRCTSCHPSADKQNEGPAAVTGK